MAAQTTKKPAGRGAGDDATPGIVREDFVATDVEGPIRMTSHMDYRTIGDLYAQASRDQEASGNEVQARVYGLLQSMTQMHFKPEETGEPYGPHFPSSTWRTMIPRDLRGQSSALAEVVSTVRHPALQARLADIAWCNERKLAGMANAAIEGYCGAVQLVLEGAGEFAGTNRGASGRDGVRMLRRACWIAKATGWKQHHRESIDGTVGQVIAHALDSKNHNGFLDAGSMAREFGCVDAATLAKQAEELAVRVDATLHVARELWGLAANCHLQSGNDGEATRCRRQAAECLVALADAAGESAMASTAFLRDAIRALREVPGTRDRRQELQSRLVSVQESIQDEMGVVSTSLNIEDEVNAVTTSLQGVSLSQAMGLFADLLRSPEPADLREQARRNRRREPALDDDAVDDTRR